MQLTAENEKTWSNSSITQVLAPYAISQFVNLPMHNQWKTLHMSVLAEPCIKVNQLKLYIWTLINWSLAIWVNGQLIDI